MDESINNGDLNSFEIVNKADLENAENSEEKVEPDDGWLDILGSGQLKKKILKPGDPENKPQRGEICIISGYGKLEDDTIVETFDNTEICVGDAEIIHGMDFVLPLMEIGEECQIEIGPRFGFGDMGYPEKNVPSNATLYYQITLHTVKPELDIPELSIERRLQLGSKKRERGNWWYSRGDNSLAVQCYRKALDFIDATTINTSNATKDELSNLIKERINVYNNLAIAQMKLESFDSALMSLENVLSLDANNVKAMYRKAKILAEKNDTDEAIQLLKILKAQKPTSSIQKELADLINKQKSNTAKEKQLYQKMFSKPLVKDDDSKKPSNNLNKILLIVGITTLSIITGAFVLKYYYPEFFDQYIWLFD